MIAPIRLAWWTLLLLAALLLVGTPSCSSAKTTTTTGGHSGEPIVSNSPSSAKWTAAASNQDDGDGDQSGKPSDHNEAEDATTTTATTTKAENQLNNNNNYKSRQQIPAEPAASAGGAALASGSASGTTDDIMAAAVGPAGKRGQLAKRAPPVSSLRVSETELLPFSDFQVEQPAFVDLMRSWPPTTKQFARLNELQRQQQSATSRPPHHRRPSSSKRRPPSSSVMTSDEPRESARGSPDPDDTSLVLNHLNEDIDDTIVTADESFEQDQLPEPATWVNYLGDLGDFIYLQLRHFFESSSRSPFDGPSKTTPSTPAASKQVEPIDDLLDDFYYDQYENSQVLYYGPQLVRQGDIFEIGCYLPNEQPAEWTKSGRSLQQTAESPSSSASSSASSSPLSPLSAGDNNLNGDNYTTTMFGPNGTPRIIRRGDFLGAKQNFSLKIFEAAPSDTGNYRCTRMSRKFHKVVVVPARTSTSQLYLIQQRLLSVVDPKSASLSPSQTSSAFVAYQTSRLYSSGAGSSTGQPTRANASRGRYQQQSSTSTITASGYSAPSTGAGTPSQLATSTRQSGLRQAEQATSLKSHLLPSYLIIEQHSLLVNCNITDEFVLRKLRENPQAPIAWYKNGKLMRQSSRPINLNATNNNPQTQNGRHGKPGSGQQQQQQQMSTNHQRIQFIGPNGRQMYITSASYSDAGDYLCSWSRLPSRQMSPTNKDDDDGASGRDQSQSQAEAVPPSAGSTTQILATNPLAAGSQMQLVAPVKLRPFKSSYHVRRGHQLRLVCQVQRGYPAAQIAWYIGNRLVDGDFLRQHPNEYAILQLNQPARLGPTVTSSAALGGQQADGATTSATNTAAGRQDDEPKLVEINPIPSGRQQMQLTANGRGQWIDYRDLSNEKYAIDSKAQQLRYLQMKLAQLTGASMPGEPAANNPNNNNNNNQASLEPAPASSGQVLLLNQASLSVLVINSLDVEKHTSRYACRATSRANTDEVTTVIRVRESKTIVVRPSNGAATLVNGQSLHFECAQTDRRDAQFLWYKKILSQPHQGSLILLDPNTDDTIEIHNERLTLLKPNQQAIGDYICRALDEDKVESQHEQATIRVRQTPYIDDFGVDTSHTGKSTVVTDGERLELLCKVSDESVPVNITWLRSAKSDDEREMVPIIETDIQSSPSSLMNGNPNDPDVQTFTAPNSVIVERVNNFSRRLIIESMAPEHRGYYTCMVDNGVTERARKTIFVRVKDKFVALWPFLGIVAQLFILFTIIYVWETQRAHKAIKSISSTSPATPTATKRPASGPTHALENVPLNS